MAVERHTPVVAPAEADPGLLLAVGGDPVTPGGDQVVQPAEVVGFEVVQGVVVAVTGTVEQCRFVDGQAVIGGMPALARWPWRNMNIPFPLSRRGLMP